MKFAYFNPTIFAIEEIPSSVFAFIKQTVDYAHTKTQYNDVGDPSISARGGQQIQLVPNQFNFNMEPFANYIEGLCQDYIDTVMQSAGITDELPVKPVLVSAWTIRQSAGSYQAMHSHEAHISGNIYVDVPNLSQGSANTDSCLDFRLPTVRNPARFVFTDSWRFKPEVGKMVIFPSYIPHTVYPWQGTGTRTVLAWDVKLVDK